MADKKFAGHEVSGFDPRNNNVIKTQPGKSFVHSEHTNLFEINKKNVNNDKKLKKRLGIYNK